MKREDRKISHAVLLTLLSALQGVIGTVTPEITDSELREGTKRGSWLTRLCVRETGEKKDKQLARRTWPR